MSTPYPSLTAAAGDELVVDVTLHNDGAEPYRAELAVTGVPEGWTAGFLGDGRPIGAVMVDPESDVTAELHITPPAEAGRGSHAMAVTASGDDGALTLPIDVTLVESLPARLVVSAEFPSVKGAPTAEFSYRITIENKGGEEALVNLGVDTPPDFDVTLTAGYGGRELTSVPVEAGGEEDIDVKVEPPPGVDAGVYNLTFHARAGGVVASEDLVLEIAGAPELSLATANELFSLEAAAAKETPLKVILANTGSAPAEPVSLHTVEPNGWKVVFSPERVDALGPGQRIELTALVTPPEDALAGDYMVTLQAVSGPASDSKDFRVTVRASDLWGFVGIGVIVLAVLVLAAAMWRFGRR